MSPASPEPVGPGPAALPVVARPGFAEVYRTHRAFVWRSARRLGVGEHATEDVAQEVFLIVHRRLEDFEGRSTIKTWLFGILLHVVRHQRRAMSRRPALQPLLDDTTVADPAEAGPLERVAEAEAARFVHEFLDSLDDDKREAFVLVDLEQCTLADAAEALGTPLQTVYSRVRAAREAFQEAVARRHVRDDRRAHARSRP